MSPVPRRIAPMLAVPGEPFDSPDHFFEVKWDGIRALAYRDGSSFWIETRNFRHALPRFPELAAVQYAIRNHEAVLDGEIVVLGPDGLPDFDAVRSRNAQESPAAIARSSAERPAVFVAFDCLVVGGRTIMAEPFGKRRAILIDTVATSEHAVVTHGVAEAGKAYFEALAGSGLEGMVAKALASPYRPGVRSRDWIKVRNVKVADCVIGGFVPKGADGFKSLLVGLYGADGALLYAGHVGTGFGALEMSELRRALDRIRSPDRPFDSIPHLAAKGAVWVRPVLVCRVEYLTLTAGGHLRHPAFQGIRSDKAPEECLAASELGRQS